MGGRAAATTGFVVAGVALAAEILVRSADPGTRFLAPALVGVALVTFGARRYGRIDPRTGAPIAGAAGVGYAVVLAVAGDPEFETVLAVLAGLSIVVLAAVDWRGIDDEGLTDRVLASGAAVVLGIAGLLSIAVWTSVLVAIGGGADLGTGARYLAGTLAIAPAAATVTVLYLAATDRGASFLDLRRPTRRDGGFVVVGTVSLVGLNLLADAVLTRFGVEFASHDLVAVARSEPGLLLALVPLAYLSVGAGEELIYRNLVQKSLYGAFSRRGAIVVASVVFAAVHFSAFAAPGTSPRATVVALAMVFVLSLVLGVIYERTGNVLVPALAHGSFDAVVYVVLYVELAG